MPGRAGFSGRGRVAEVAVAGVAGADRQGQVRAALVQAATAGIRRASIATSGQLSGYLFSKAARRPGRPESRSKYIGSLLNCRISRYRLSSKSTYRSIAPPQGR